MASNPKVENAFEALGPRERCQVRDKAGGDTASVIVLFEEKATSRIGWHCLVVHAVVPQSYDCGALAGMAVTN